MRFDDIFACQRHYPIDRLVGAANLFDLLPDDTFTGSETVSSELLDARNRARELFRNLPDSADRNSVLGALGRVGKLSLKKKVRSRSQVIVRLVGELFPDIDFVTDHAIECRNFYIHGTKPKLDYGSGIRPISFFTDTLEFVFVVSDLIECGWSTGSSLRRLTSTSHPFGRYRATYNDDLAALKALSTLS